MKKNLYFRKIYQSTRAMEELTLSATLFVLYFPSTLLAVFIRKNLGERHFSTRYAFMMFVVLAYVPIGYRFQIENLDLIFSGGLGDYKELMNRGYGEFKLGRFLLINGTWYLFLAAFGYMCFQRHQEIKRLPSVFDFQRTSVYAGDIHPFFYNFKWNNRLFDTREIETILEPLFFLIIGLVLVLIEQSVGYLIVISAICYWANYTFAYHEGDQMIMDMIDQQLFSEEMIATFVEDKEAKDTRGVMTRSRKPSDPNNRRKLSDDMDTDDDDVIK